MWRSAKRPSRQRSGPSIEGWGTPSRSRTRQNPPVTGLCGICMCTRAPWRVERRPGGTTRCRPSRAELQRLQGFVNKYDYKTPEIITRRAQSKAFKKRQAQKYFTIEVVHHADRPAAPLELRYDVDHTQVQRDADLDGVYLLVAGGKAATLSDAEDRKSTRLNSSHGYISYAV